MEQYSFENDIGTQFQFMIINMYIYSGIYFTKKNCSLFHLI